MASKPRTFLASPDGLKRLNASKAELKLTIANIAEQAGVSTSTVRRLWHPELGKRVSEASIVAIASVLQLSLEEIVLQEIETPDNTPLAEAERRIQEAIATRVTELKLSDLSLTSLPESICQLVNLKSLHLGRNKLTKLPNFISQLTNLEELSLQQNQLRMVPPELGQLANLKVLSLDRNQLRMVPPELGQLANLKVLSLDRNQLRMVPPELGQLANLTRLDLSQNQLKTVPPELGQLPNLTEFSLQQNQLSSVPPELGQLANLRELYLDQNQLKTVPPELGQLANLRELYLDQNQLRMVPPELGQLANLNWLHLDQNQLRMVPPELGQLANLRELYLYQNQLKTVPPELGQLAKLRVLSLFQNQLSSVPEFIGQLTRLQRIDLNENGLTALPEFLRQLSDLQALLLHGNQQLGIPNEILGPTWEEVINGVTPANPQEILSYYSGILADRKPLNEAKLILVGFGAVGKTSLVNRLIDNTFDPDSKKTEGIQITQWPIRLHNSEDIKLHVWDFGGQEIMHSTHQFFFTERSLYLLVLNGRQGHEDTDAEYWLELINSFGGDSPVIVVLNKVKDHPFDVNRSALKQKFPNICDFIKTDCEARIGIDELRDTIERETDRLEHLHDPFPASWFEIKNQLATMTKNYISFEQYRGICKEEGEADWKSQDFLASHLHDLGIVLNYKDDPRLRDTHVLNPLWVTNGIYKLLNAHDLTDKQGELALTNLAQILDPQDYPPERHSFLLELMRKFELCFRFQEDEDRYLIPDLLDKQQPEAARNFNPAECLNFRYEYPILPEGLLPRFIVRTHVLSTQQLRWRTGVILAFEGNQALVKGDRHDRCVTINVNGPIASRRRLLAIIRSDFERIHNSFKFKAKEQVPVPEYPELILNYQDLLALEKARRSELPVVVNGEVIELNIIKLLKGLNLDDTRKSKLETASRSQALRLFCSYSHQDEALREALDVRLKILQRSYPIQNWHDRRITPGENWSEQLDRNLEQADIILLMVSPDFIASDYCYQIEMNRALELHAAQEATVIPILIRPVSWDDRLPFSHIQALPKNLKPVTQWQDSDNAWLSVEQGIKQALQEKIGEL